MSDTAFTLLLGLLVFGPPVTLLLLGRRFWRLRHVDGLTGRARQVRLAWLGVLASGMTGSVYLFLRVVLAEIAGGHSSAQSIWPWGHAHVATLVLLGSLVVVLLLSCFPAQRPASVSFAAGALLVLAGPGLHWYLTDHQQDRLAALRNASMQYERRGWQRAVTDSFQAQLTRRPEVQTNAARAPVFPGGPTALKAHLRTRSPTQDLPPQASVWVEFIVESDGHLTLPHVVAGLGPGYDEAAVRAVKRLPPFRPSPIEEGRQVRVLQVEVPFYH